MLLLLSWLQLNRFGVVCFGNFSDQETPPSAEVATFTLFFMAFTAMVGKELLEIYHSTGGEGKTILSTYVPTTADANSVATADDDDDFEDAVDEEEKFGVEAMKNSRPAMGGMLEDDDVPNGHVSAPPSVIGNYDKFQNAQGQRKNAAGGYGTPPDDDTTAKSTASSKSAGSEPRRRFRDSLSTLQIEEAKATGRAQLGLAFEMLTMMKKRALKADPEAYQSLIDACGRVGDTKRATELLAKMHEDGIVADGTVYACLVSAFSNDTAWKKGTNEEELPGKKNITCINFAVANEADLTSNGRRT
jgi:pentatricopeptide repeat protein